MLMLQRGGQTSPPLLLEVLVVHASLPLQLLCDVSVALGRGTLEWSFQQLHPLLF